MTPSSGDVCQIAGADHGSGAVPDLRPRIELPRPGVLLSDFSRQVGDAMAVSGLYLQDGEPVFLSPGSDKERERLELVSPAAFRTLSERELVTTTPVTVGRGPDGPIRELIPSSMAEQSARAVLSSHDFRERLRPLERLIPISVPGFDVSGALALLPQGYDSARRVLVLRGAVYDLLPLALATDYLRDLLREFPFADDAGRSLSVQISAMVSRFTSLLLPASAQIPVHVWNANTQRAGKTLAAKVVEIPVSGRAITKSLPKDEKDLRQLIDSEVLSGAESIIFDNVKEKVESAALEQFVTTAYHGGRRLGGNKMFSLPKQTMVMITANQCQLSPDMAGRCLFVDLWAEEADPQRRVIERPIGDAWLMDPVNRYAILSALWSLVHAWDAAGRPPGTGRIVGFEEWVCVVGGIVENAGFGDPTRRPDGELIDHEFGEMVELVRLMACGAFRDDAVQLRMGEGVSFHDLISLCRRHQLFEEEIKGNSKDGDFSLFPGSKSKMSGLFGKYNGRIFHLGDDLGTVRFERIQKGKSRDSRLWRVV